MALNINTSSTKNCSVLLETAQRSFSATGRTFERNT